MDLVKSIKVVLGLVSSGGLVVILSGTAFAAASAGSVPVDAMVKPVAPSVAVVPSLQAQTSDTIITLNKQSSSQTVSGTVSVSSVGTSGSPVVAASENGGQNGLTSGTDSESKVTAVGSTTAGRPVADSSNNSSPKPAVVPVENISGLVPATSDSNASTQSLVTPASTAISELQSQVQEAGIVSGQRSIVIHSKVLEVQPRITSSRPAAMDDLAKMIPSASGVQSGNPARVPAPLQPTDVLTRLTVELAGVVVPQAYLTPMLGAIDFFARLTILLAGMILAIGFALISFGTWLRRGGYAHAARSDVAAGRLRSAFIAIFRLGYVSALQPAHSPFLMKLEMQSGRGWCTRLQEERV